MHIIQSIFVMALTCTMTQLHAQNDATSATFEPASEAVVNMRVGWNLGNTLDSNSGDTLNMWIEADKNRTVSTYETAWGQKVTSPALFKMLKEQGFNAIRVPVTWYPHMEATFSSVTGYNDPELGWIYTPWFPSQDGIGTRIQSSWLRRVKQVVDYVMAQDMYCIINVHHDTGAGNTAWLIADETVYAEQRARFKALWTQIAEYFREYDQHLLFEGYNEMLDSQRSWCFASFNTDSQYDSRIAESAYTAINAYAQSFVDAVRATGGNNLYRNLVVCTYGACDGGGSWNTHLSDPLKMMMLPADSVEGHLILEVHSYPDITDLRGAKASLLTTISNLRRYLSVKAPIIFGEWGVSAGGENAENKNEFVQYFAQRAKAAGFGLFYWMGVSDGADRTVPQLSEPELVGAMMKGYYGEEGYVSAIKMLETDGILMQSYDVYDIMGRKVADMEGSRVQGFKSSSVQESFAQQSLLRGIYIYGKGRKVLIK